MAAAPGPITVAGAPATITEAQSDPATDVQVDRRCGRRLARCPRTFRHAASRSRPGASTASETLVTFTNQPAGGNYGTLKVCKLTETPAYLGRCSRFSVNGGPIVSTEANDAFDDPANWSCRILGTFQAGSIVNVHEQIPAGTEVQCIDTDPATAWSTSTRPPATRLSRSAPASPSCYYDNEPTPPAGTGWLEVCKNAAC